MGYAMRAIEFVREILYETTKECVNNYIYPSWPVKEKSADASTFLEFYDVGTLDEPSFFAKYSLKVLNLFYHKQKDIQDKEAYGEYLLILIGDVLEYHNTIIRKIALNKGQNVTFIMTRRLLGKTARMAHALGYENFVILIKELIVQFITHTESKKRRL